MVEVISTSRKIFDLEEKDIFAEISIVESQEQVKAELYVFREHPENKRMLLLRFIGEPNRKQDYLAEMFYALKDPEGWLYMHNDE